MSVNGSTRRSVGQYEMGELGSIVFPSGAHTLDPSRCPECGWPVLLASCGVDPESWFLADVVIVSALSRQPFARVHRCDLSKDLEGQGG